MDIETGIDFKIILPEYEMVEKERGFIDSLIHMQFDPLDIEDPYVPPKYVKEKKSITARVSICDEGIRYVTEYLNNVIPFVYIKNFSEIKSSRRESFKIIFETGDMWQLYATKYPLSPDDLSVFKELCK